jgi:predicted kinase
LLAAIVGFNMADLMSSAAKLTIILGSPASGKTTLARRLALRWSVPVLCKDDIKEALFDSLGQGDRAWSRRLSEASFTTLMHLAQRQLSLGQSCIVEGNWRAVNLPGIELALRDSGACALQIWCCADPAEIVRRFTARTRHAGHLDALMPRTELERAACEAPMFLELQGPRFIFRSDTPGAFDALICALQSSPL